MGAIMNFPFKIKFKLNTEWEFRWIGFTLDSQILSILKDRTKQYPKVEAIKFLRAKTGLGLMDAKRKVEQVNDKYLDKLLRS